MKQNCQECGQSFEIAASDLKFYERISPVFSGQRYTVPVPTHCPSCRQQRRLAFRNEKNLHHRKCDLSGRQIVSMYPADAPFPVYDQDIWWSDQYDPLQYGRDFDFSRPFFEQFAELRKVVPRMSLNVIGNENSYYTNYALRNRNSYLVTTADYNEDCYYGRFSDRNYRSVDFDFTYDSKFCYEAIDLHKCNQCLYSQKCTESSDLYFCYDMRNCHNCIFSANLRGQQYHVFNKKVSKEEFKKIKEEFASWKIVQLAKGKAQEFFRTVPRKHLENVQCEDSIGDYLQTSKNAQYCFDSYNLEDVKFATHLFDAKDCYDWDFVAAGSELCYQMVSCAYKLHHCAFTMNSWDSNSDLYYCDLCLGNKNCFGSIGLRKKEYCVLNRQYSQEEYKKLVPKIIEHMQKTGEWGEFFPTALSPFGYNESVAQEYFPLTESDVRAKAWNWQEAEDAAKNYLGPEVTISDRIQDVPEEICDHILRCERSGKPYKIIPQELKFYQEMSIPLPRHCPEERHKERMSKRNPRRIWNRNCMKCNQAMVTSYAPERSEIVYCEKCYLETVQ